MFTERLRKLRGKRRISQDELAKVLSMSQQAIAKWETGKATPDPEMLSKIADYFDVSVDYLLGRVDKPYLAIMEDIPDELRVEGAEVLIMAKELVKEGLTAEEMADIVAFVRKMNKRDQKN